MTAHLRPALLSHVCTSIIDCIYWQMKPVASVLILGLQKYVRLAWTIGHCNGFVRFKNSFYSNQYPVPLCGEKLYSMWYDCTLFLKYLSSFNLLERTTRIEMHLNTLIMDYHAYTADICQHWYVKTDIDVCSAIFDWESKNNGFVRSILPALNQTQI